MPRLVELSVEQARMLCFLDTGRVDAADHGRPVDEDLMRLGFRVADELLEMGLIELSEDASAGFEASGWYRLTLLGRRVREAQAAGEDAAARPAG